MEVGLKFDQSYDSDDDFQPPDNDNTVHHIDLDKLDEYFRIADVNISVGLHASIRENVLLLDTGAGESILGNRNLFESVSRVNNPIRLKGVNNVEERLVCNQGGVTEFGVAYYSDQIRINVLSFGRVVDSCANVKYMEGNDSFIVQPKANAEAYVFRRRPGRNSSNIYTCQLDGEASGVISAEVFVTTVQSQKNKYKVREVERAEVARNLIRNFSCTASKLIKLITNNKIRNLDVTPQDVARAVDIWGKDIFGMKGKTTRNIPVPYEREFDAVPKKIRQNQIVYIDLMFVNGTAYLLSMTSSNLDAIERLGSTKSKDIFEKLKIMLDRIKALGAVIVAIRSDEESGVISNEMRQLMVNYDQVIDLDISPGGEAVGKIEREIRTLRERARSIILQLPFVCDVVLEEWLLRNRVNLLNWEPRDTTVSFDAPNEAVLGRTLDARIDLKYSFGEYVDFADGDTDHDLQHERTKGAVALMPTGNRDGGWYFLVIGSWRVVVRRDGIRRPMPDSAIAEINRHATPQQIAKANQGETLKMGLWRDGIFRPVEVDDEDADAEPDIVEEHMPQYIVPNVLETQEAMDHFEESEPVDAAPYEQLNAVKPDGVPQGDVHARDLLGDIEDIPGEYNITGSSEYESYNDSVVQQLPDQPAGGYSGELDSRDQPMAADESMRDSGNIISSQEPMNAVSDEPPRYNLRRGKSSEHGRWDKRTVGAIEGEPITGVPSHGRRRIKKVKRVPVYNLTIRQAIDKLGDDAVDSIVKEIQQLDDRRSFEGVKTEDLTFEERRRIISSSMFLKDKYTADGKFEKLKARLVAGGHQQDRSIYDESGSPTATTASIFIVASIAAEEGRAVATVDFPGAFLNAEMPKNKGKEVFMRLNKFESLVLCKIDPSYQKFMRADGNMVVKLTRALYGCVESGRLWYNKLSKDLESIGYIKNPQDMCVFNRIESDGSQSTLVIHVDDMKITAKTESHLDTIINEVQLKYPKLEVHRGRVFNYLGMVFDYSTAGCVKITMPNFTEALLDFCKELYGVAPTPAKENLFKIDANSEPLDPKRKEFFHSVTQKLLYLGKRVRPEILTAVSFLTKRVQYSTEEDYVKLNRVIQYIRRYKDIGIVLQGSEKAGVFAYVDASYGVHPDLKSHTGSTISIGKGPIHCKSSTQKINTKSSTEAELIALSDSSNQIIWTRNFLLAQNYSIEEATIYEDNKSTIEMVKNGKSNSDRTKHIASRFYFIADRASSKEIKLVYMPTDDMIADLLTKPLQGKKFIILRRLLLNWYDDGDEL